MNKRITMVMKDTITRLAGSFRKLIFPYWVLLFLATGYIVGCKNHPDISVLFTEFAELRTPCREGGEPNLFASDQGTVFLSWLEYVNDSTEALLFSVLDENEWGEAKEIARGNNWFANWADFPSLVVHGEKDQKLAAHWLQKRAEGTYDYDIHIAQSNDGGYSWGNSFIPHRDSIAAEHGFVSMFPLKGGEIFATWLDGRNTKSHGSNHEAVDGHGHGGAMTLRSAIFNDSGQLREEYELDQKICDCCQTAATQTSRGIIVAYRDRTDEEVRDISLVRQVNGVWSDPSPVHEDGWKINGCPVNGPAMDAIGENVAIAWFSAADEISRVNLAFSENGGEHFSAPVRIDEGNPMGRVDLVLLNENQAVVSWLEQKEDGAEIMLMKLNSRGKRLESVSLVHTQSARQSGFPRLVKAGNRLILAWTHVSGGKTIVMTGILSL